MEVLLAPLLQGQIPHPKVLSTYWPCSSLWAHLNGSISLPEKVPTSIAAVDTAQSHEKAEREEVPMVIVAHTVV